MKKWSEVEESPEYKRLSRAEKDAAREQYFDQVIKPQVPPVDLDSAKSQFLQQTSIDGKRSPKEMTTPFLNPGGEAAANLATGTVAAPVSGLAGIAGAVLPGPPGQGAEWQRKTQEALTYQPRSEMGKSVAGLMAAPFTALANVADYAGGKVTDVTGSPALGAATNTSLQMLPALIAKGAKGPVKRMVEKSAAGLADAKVRNFVEDNTWADARKEGFVVPPGTINPSVTAKNVERFGGRSQLRQEAINRNQEIGDRIAKREAGILDKEPLDSGSFEAARARIAGPYNEVSALSPQAKALWNNVREKRREAKRKYDQYYSNKDPEALNKAETLTASAERMEGKIEEIAIKVGNPDLVTRLKAARVQFAKNYQVEKATNIGNGHVDMGMIGRDMQKKPGVNTGGLSTIGKFARGFSDYVGKVREVKEPESHLGVGLSMGGAHGYLFQKGLPWVGGSLRSLALSDLMQAERSYKPGLKVRLADVATRNPATFAVAPAVGLRMQDE